MAYPIRMVSRHDSDWSVWSRGSSAEVTKSRLMPPTASASTETHRGTRILAGILSS